MVAASVFRLVRWMRSRLKMKKQPSIRMFAATAGLAWTFARLSRFLFPDGRFLKLNSSEI